jgi:hypothetical protein
MFLHSHLMNAAAVRKMRQLKERKLAQQRQTMVEEATLA